VNDLDAVVDQALKKGFQNYSAAQLESQLNLALQEDTEFDDLYPGVLGPSRFKTFLSEWEEALRAELCEKGILKDAYKKWLESSDTASTVKSIASVVIATIQPGLAVASVGVLFALWVLKVGLNYWCKGSSA